MARAKNESNAAPMKVDLSGQVALVTGASRGLGEAVAKALGACGARVVCVARNIEKLGDTVESIVAAGGAAEAFPCDVTSSTSVNELIEKIEATLGRLDILVNNAGITRDTLIPRMTDEQWDEVINTNLRGAFLFTRAASRLMMSQRYGRIINMASVSGLIGNPGQANYSASKAGLIGMTRTVARELASRNVTVNAVAPGFIETEMTATLGPLVVDEVKKRVPAKRLGLPADVAAAVLFLASRDAGYLTGQVITVDGGMTA
jgi:3-oxoacyl-[acyl-carrier protein] reductase